MKRKIKKLVSLSLVATFLFGFAGCQSTNSTGKEEIKSTEATTKIIVDHVGAEVEIPTEVNRVVVSNPLPIASVLSVYLGGAEKIVGLHPTAMSAAANGLLGEIYPEILNAETDFVNGSEFNVEELLKIDPDVVIGVPKDQAEKLREAGIPAVTVSYTDWDFNVLETYDGWIKLFDQIFGESTTTEKVSEYSKEAYELIQGKVSTIAEEDKKKVLFLFNYDENNITTSGPSHYGQYWAEAIGAINVGQDSVEPEAISINMEQIYEWNPDVIILTNFTSAQPEDLYNNAIGGDDWSTINAVKNGEVYKMPLGLYRTYTPGSDTPVTLQWLAKTVYPELFEDVNIIDVTKDYYKTYHNIDMTEEQIKNMYNPPRESATGA